MSEFLDEGCMDGAAERVGVDGGKLAEAVRVLEGITGREGATRCVIVRDGMVIWRGRDADVRQGVSSVTKSVLTLVMGVLIDEGRCGLETRAAEIDPRLGELYPGMTLRHLVTFTSGYRGREASAEVAPFEPGEPLFGPGERFCYGWDPFLLALLLTKVAGESLRDLFRRRIAEPIGLDAGGAGAWQWGDWGTHDALTGLQGVAVCGGSGLYGRGLSITVRGLARVGWLVACGGVWEGHRVVSEEHVRAATEVQVGAGVLPLDAAAWYARLPGRYGFYWWTNGVGADGERLWTSAPAGCCAMQGNQDNWCFVIPEWRMVVVRLGTDGGLVNWGYDGFLAALGRAAGR